MIKDRIWTLVSRKLSGEATASELTELADLIKNQANTDLYLQAIDEFWRIPPEKDEEFLEATYHLHLNRLKEKGFDLETDPHGEDSDSSWLAFEEDVPKNYRRRKLMALFTLFAACALFFLMRSPFKHAAAMPVSNKIEQSEVSTKSGSRSKIQLPDGSSVWLNGGSKIVYDNRHFGENLREVVLTGEAYFDVVKNKEKPFIIHANKIDIKVTGTTFNVRAYPGEKNTETSLVKGSIEVTMTGRQEKIMMKPNDKLIVSNDEVMPERRNEKPAQGSPIVKNSVISMTHLTLARDENTVVETAWVDNKLVFDKETFEDVALKMERWYGVSIRFADDDLKLQRLTGTFEKETVTEALQALQISTPFFRYKLDNQSINIFK